MNGATTLERFESLVAALMSVKPTELQERERSRRAARAARRDRLSDAGEGSAEATEGDGPA